MLREAVNEPFGVGGEVARDADDVCLRVVLRHVAAVREGDIGEDRDLHDAFDSPLVGSSAGHRFPHATRCRALRRGIQYCLSRICTVSPSRSGLTSSATTLSATFLGTLWK